MESKPRVSRTISRAISGGTNLPRPLVVRSRIVSQGRQFQPKAERKLGPLLRYFASRASHNTNSVVIAVRELVVPFGIVDCGVLVVQRARLEARIASGIPPVRYEADAVLLSALSSRLSKTEGELANVLGWSPDAVVARLRGLVRKGAVLPTRTGFRRHPSMRPLGRALALEAKMYDWKRALRQAAVYGLWFDSVGVVMSGRRTSWFEVERAFRGAGVGLAIGRRWLASPRPRALPFRRRLVASESFLASLLLKGSKAPPRSRTNRGRRRMT